MEEIYYSTMNPLTIMRKSIHTFLQNFHHLSSTAAVLLPFASAALLSPPIIASSYLFRLVHGRLRSVFLAAGIPPQSELFAILNLKLSLSILSFIFLLPFSLSSLLLAKASIAKLLLLHRRRRRRRRRHTDQNTTFFSSIAATQLCGSLIILSANATCLSLLAAAFNFSAALGLTSPRFRLLLSATGAILYSVALANAHVICGLGVIVSAAEGSRGFAAVLKASAAIGGSSPAALSLAVMTNAALAGVEALFRYRVVGAYDRAAAADLFMVFEAVVVAYLYALVLSLDTVVGCVLLKSCRMDYQIPVESLKEEEAFESVL